MLKHFRGWRVALVVALAVTLFAGTLSGPVQAQGGKSIAISFTQEPDSLNPMYSTQYFSGLARRLILLSPWDYDDQLNLVPVLAAEIPSLENGGVSADGKTITIKVREGINWSDGTPVSADDFVFTAEMYRSEKNSPLGRGIFGGEVESVTAPDPMTVVTTFSEPYAPWPANLFGAILPAHVLRPVFEKDGTLDKAEWNAMPTVVNGPFILKEYQRGQFMIFERNPNYGLTPAKLDQILIRFVPDEAAQVAAVKAGDSDIAVFLAPSEAEDLKATTPVTIVTVASGYNEGWFMNLNPEKGHPALQDMNVRRAISLAIHREELVAGLTNNIYPISKGFWDQLPYQSPKLETPKFDPAESARLLDAAGWVVGADGIREKDGKKLVLRYATNQRGLRKDAQRVIEEYLKTVGIGVELINYDNQIYLASYEKEGPIARGEFDVAQWAISPSFPDPATRRFFIREIGTAENSFVGSNWAHIRDEELDRLMTEQQSTVDVEARKQLFYHISEIVSENVYWMPLWWDPDIWAVRNNITGVKFSGGTAWWNVTDWDVTQ